MKFRLKLTLCMLGLLSVLFGAGGSLLIASSFHSALQREQAAAYNAYQIVLGTLQIVNRVGGQSDYADVSRTLEQLSAQNAGAWAALQLYTASSSVYGEGTVPPVPSGQAVPGTCAIRYASGGPDRHSLVVSGALDVGGETLYLDMARDISPLFTARSQQQQAYFWVFLLMTALCAALSYSISRVLTQPLARLSRASRALAGGTLSARAPVRSRDEVGLLARDFNAMAQALEENISQLQDAAARQERFLGSFAHELKTPMTSIIGYADLIRGQTLSPEEQAEAANYIVAEGKRLENLSHKLLELLVLKKTDPSFSRVRPAALIRGLAAHIGPVYRRQDIRLVCDCEDGECLLEPDLVRSLLLNLWDNARKAMDGRGGRIYTQLQMRPGGCRILVVDNGGGMPPAALEHLTEAFYRVDRSRARAQGGVGLGLALCREIAALHGGSIRFQSHLGTGTAVTVELLGGAK